MVTNGSPQTLQQAIRFYADVDTCQEALIAARWPDGVECPHCGSKNVTYLTTQRRWQCKEKPYHARRQFSVKVGTIFEDSPIGLDKWFVAIWLISSAKNGISSYEIHRAIGVTQKSAWFMLHRIRLAMQTRSFNSQMSGDVEVDETFIGGRTKWKNYERRRSNPEKSRKGGTAGKVAVMGLLERHDQDHHSKIRLEVLPDTKQHTLESRVRKHVDPDLSVVMTDANLGYHKLAPDYIHEFVDHVDTYVRGNVHTNGLENFWALLKRGLRGTYISVEPFHLFRYLDEQAFRFNSRKQKDGERFSEMLSRMIGKRLTLADLTGKAEPQSAV